ncbi:hypothetical protein DM2_598 [Halorubrum sp. DM2]|nr:hypothetical protein DM2_598 [Halorubrum sp. DM2]
MASPPAGFRTFLTDQSVSIGTNRMDDTERPIPDAAYSPLHGAHSPFHGCDDVTCPEAIR